jgi:hypothetical protein
MGRPLIIVTHDTIANPGILEVKVLPRRFFGRVVVWPRGAGPGVRLRIVAEFQFLRYLATLAPFIVIPLMRPDLALPVTQAPLVMLLLVAVVEMRVLRLSARARARAVGAEEGARRLDRLAFRARAALRTIAARQGIAEGELRLVVEQSDLARIPPLTLVSVQTDRPAPRLLRLDAGDRAALAGLFDAELTERDLLAANHREGVYLRDIAQEARAVSAQSRLAAALDRRRAGG